jgi:hypothetical protein
LAPASRSWARLRTIRAAGLLCLARLLVAVTPFHIWRQGLGLREQSGETLELAEVRRLAAHVERAAWRLPFTVKCLPQAVALSWQLRRREVDHCVVFAVRPPGQRGAADMLHAWVEYQNRIVLGELPGPWVRVLELPDR